MSASVEGLAGELYDFIIVGGGTSGLVVASRLTEDPNIRVLVLEAGANRLNDPRIVIPGLAASTYDDPDFDWCISSTPQSALDGRVLAHPSGRVLGGSTAINLGMVIFPSKAGFDAWEELGNPSWNWSTISPYLRKFHTFSPPSQEVQEELSINYIDSSLQGTDGPIQMSFGGDIGWYTPFNKAWPKAFKTLNYDITGDPISGESYGAFSNTGTVDPKTRGRSHAGSAYYNEKVAERPNLRVVTEVTVEKILLENKDDLTASGVVAITSKGAKHIISAKKEVILAAGALNSPKILELSGIGDSNLLKSFGIDTLVSNKYVGENLQEHGYVPFCYEVVDPMTSGDMLRVPEISGALMEAYKHGGAGPLGVCSIASSFMPITNFGMGELDSLLKKYIDDDEGTVYKDFPAKKAQYAVLKKLLHKPDEASGQYTMAPFQINPQHGPSPRGLYGMKEPGEYVSIVSVLNHPFSRGSAHASSPDPSKLPTVDTGLLAHPLDLELHARHTLWAEKLSQTEPIASLLKKDGRRLHLQGKEELDLETAKRLTKERIISHYHYSGTCAMMPKELGGVVDNKLRVYETRNLRIVDASIFPIIPRGNIQADVYAVAERAADIIKGDL
ncbi:putative aryl-alcohol dehydrogenase [Phaeomoniella chlamydospora]|uniref:Putative aryl-alcohol dehydrogenase n=1 Tax=Phaeomoniella chlamydospora TaxID=158046 RepID=A0A0G2EZA0_PHACM|nr:putative aryl-alcohol dehydrogenase [Phaeomoniella chlamydospora]